MRKIINIFLFLIFLIFFQSTYTDFIICDSGNIELSADNLSQICNSGYESTDVSKIESFTGNFVNFNPGYWNINYDLNNTINFTQSFPIGYFDNNISTVVNIINPIYDSQIGYLENTFDNSINILDLDKQFPVGYFDDIKNTVTNIINPEYNNLVGYISKNTVIYTNTGSVNISNNQGLENISNNLPKIVDKITIKDFYENIFRKYSNNDFLYYGYTKSEYDNFINNIVNTLLSKTYKNSLPFISDIEQKRIELDIENKNFQKKISKMMSNMKKINKYFENIDNDNYLYYMMDYSSFNN
ncbi:MAG: hypothetical protein PHS49_01575 [Candidatus Gracilibacteria bacterium]|nr:hypothetical protein [Candidatus Gracilibacteria bacterium]